MSESMNATAPYLHEVPPAEATAAMSEYHGEEKRSGEPDRRQANAGSQWWRDGRFYVALATFLVTLATCAWFIARSIAITGDRVGEMRSALVTVNATIQQMSNDSARKDEKIRTLEDEVRQLKISVADVQKSQNDYNYNLSTRLARIEK